MRWPRVRRSRINCWRNCTQVTGRRARAGYACMARRPLRPTHRQSRTDWLDAPEGVDVIQNPEMIRRHFPTFDPEISTVLHVRRAGDISGQQLGSLMLEEVRAAGGAVSRARVTEIVGQDGGFALKLRGEDGEQTLACRDPRQRRRPVCCRDRANAGGRTPGRERVSPEDRVRRQSRCHRPTNAVLDRSGWTDDRLDQPGAPASGGG